MSSISFFCPKITIETPDNKKKDFLLSETVFQKMSKTLVVWLVQPRLVFLSGKLPIALDIMVDFVFPP